MRTRLRKTKRYYLNTFPRFAPGYIFNIGQVRYFHGIIYPRKGFLWNFFVALPVML